MKVLNSNRKIVNYSFDLAGKVVSDIDGFMNPEDEASYKALSLDVESRMGKQ